MWDFQASLDTQSQTDTFCLQILRVSVSALEEGLGGEMECF